MIKIFELGSTIVAVNPEDVMITAGPSHVEGRYLVMIYYSCNNAPMEIADATKDQVNELLKVIGK